MNSPDLSPIPSSGHPPSSPVVQAKVIHNGPLQIKGTIELVDHDGNSYDLKGRRSVLLCRCGGSTTKPFCDGTHSRTGFAAAERAVAEAEDESPSSGTGTLSTGTSNISTGGAGSGP